MHGLKPHMFCIIMLFACAHVCTVYVEDDLYCTCHTVAMGERVNYNGKKSKTFQSKVVLSVSTDCRIMEAISVSPAIVYNSYIARYS